MTSLSPDRGPGNIDMFDNGDGYYVVTDHNGRFVHLTAAQVWWIAKHLQPSRAAVLECIAEAADDLLSAGTFKDKDGTVYKTFCAPAEARDELADVLADLDTVEDLGG